MPVISISREYIIIEDRNKKKLENNYESIKLLSRYEIGNIYYFAAISRSSQFKNQDSIFNQMDSNFLNFYNLIKILINACQYPKVFFCFKRL